MICPACGSNEVRPIYGEAVTGTHGVRRQYHCKGCDSKFTTLEFYETGDNGAARILTLLAGIRKQYDALGEIIKSIASGQKTV
ncbi:MAG: hypothetical protein IBX72_03915 [Nitrospirae bacterium]|nr:hypothetical protein [Nitrospirota bacterium]